MVRAVNSEIDSGKVKKGDVPPLLAALARFDEIFSVLKDDDAEKMQPIVEWAKAEGREKDISPELLDIVQSAALSDQQINQKIEQMKAARAAKKYAESDSLRAELTAAGIIIEQTKEGVRWRRK